MDKQRLNDTTALVARPFQAGESHSICTRKIDNGFITEVSVCNPNTGAYQRAETFTKNPPRITAPRLDGRQGVGVDSGGSTLAQTKAYLGGDV